MVPEAAVEAVKEIGHVAAVATQTSPGEMSAIDARNRKPAVVEAAEMMEVSVVDRDEAVSVVVAISNQEARCEVIAAVAIVTVHIRFIMHHDSSFK